jgi:hypothetical protein
MLRHDAPEPAVCSQRLPPDWPVPGSALLRHAWDHPPMHQARGGPHHRGRKKAGCIVLQMNYQVSARIAVAWSPCATKNKVCHSN